MALTRIGSVGLSTGIDINAGVGTFTGNLTVGGVLTYEDVTNVDSIGIITARAGVLVGSGITLSPDGDGFFTGIITATSYAGDGSALTGIDATQIVTGNTSVQTVDTGSDGHVKVNTEGSERLRITSDGKVGISTAAPTHNLDIHSSGNTYLKLLRSGYNPVYIGNAAGEGVIETTGDTFFKTGGSERVRIDSSGRLLLGTTTEGSAGADEFTINTASGHGGMTIRNDTSSNGNIWFSDGTSGAAEYAGYVQYAHNDDHMVFGTGGSERMRITSDGRVSIGGMAPDTGVNLHIESSGETNMILEGSSSTVGGYLMLKNKNNTANSSMAIQFLDASGQGVSEISGVAMSDANNQGYLALKTRPNGGSMTERFKISDIGVQEYTQQSNVRTFNFAFSGGVGGSTTTQNIATLTNVSGSTAAVAHVYYVSTYGIANDYIYSGIWVCGTRRKNSNSGWNAQSTQTANGGSGSAGPVVVGWSGGVLSFTCTAYMGYTIHVSLTVYNATTTIQAL